MEDENKIPIFRADQVMFLEENDHKYDDFKKSLDEEGFSPSEIWNLDYVIACFVLPRLKHYRKFPGGYPGNLSHEKWQKIIDDMIFAFELTVKEGDSIISISDEDRQRQTKGMRRFAHYFGSLWN